MSKINDIQGVNGTALYVAAEKPATYDEAEYSQITFTEISDVREIPTFGGGVEVPSFVPVKTGLYDKRKGTLTYQRITIPFANVVSKDGQKLLQSGFDGVNRRIEHSFKIENENIGTIYFTGIVAGFQFNYDEANSMNMADVSLDILSRPVFVVPGSLIDWGLGVFEQDVFGINVFQTFLKE